MRLRTSIVMPALLAAFLSVNSLCAAELCYVGDGGHLYLQKVGTEKLAHELEEGMGKLSELLGGKSSGEKRITPDNLTGGACRMPQWLDKDRIIFVYDLSPDSVPPKTKVGILNIRSGSIEWIAPLGGSVAIGYDKSTGAVDFMKMTKNNPDSESSEVYLGQYDLKSRKARSGLAFKSWGYLTPKPIYRWPEPSLRLLSIGTSDVSDQVGIYSPATKKFTSVKWLKDDWKAKYLGGWATTAMAPGARGVFAMSVLGGQGQLKCTLGIVNKSTGAVKKVRSTGAIVRTPAFSSDGSYIAWTEDDMTATSKTIWISATSGAKPQEVASGWDPAWRP